jgi:hypothetical protein
VNAPIPLLAPGQTSCSVPSRPNVAFDPIDSGWGWASRVRKGWGPLSLPSARAQTSCSIPTPHSLCSFLSRPSAAASGPVEAGWGEPEGAGARQRALAWPSATQRATMGGERRPQCGRGEGRKQGEGRCDEGARRGCEDSPRRSTSGRSRGQPRFGARRFRDRTAPGEGREGQGRCSRGPSWPGSQGVHARVGEIVPISVRAPISHQPQPASQSEKPTYTPPATPSYQGFSPFGPTTDSDRVRPISTDLIGWPLAGARETDWGPILRTHDLSGRPCPSSSVGHN